MRGNQSFAESPGEARGYMTSLLIWPGVEKTQTLVQLQHPLQRVIFTSQQITLLAFAVKQAFIGIWAPPWAVRISSSTRGRIVKLCLRLWLHFCLCPAVHFSLPRWEHILETCCQVKTLHFSRIALPDSLSTEHRYDKHY